MQYLVAVDDCFVDCQGGSARVAWDMALAMRDRGHSVTMVVMGDEAANGHRLDAVEGIEVLRVKRPLVSRYNPVRFFSGVAAVSDAVKQHLTGRAWDVVHIHSLQTGRAVLASIPANTRVLTTMHSPTVMEYDANHLDSGAMGAVKGAMGRQVLQRMERKQLAASSGIHVLSDYTRRQLIRLHPVAGRITVLPHWVRPDLKRTHDRLEARRRLGWPQDATVFFTVRVHGRRYGIDLAIRAVAPLVKSDRCRFYIAGDGPLRQHNEALARELGLGQGVHFTGRLSDADLSMAYQAADAFLLPTRALECFGLIILESLAHGCPVLASDAAAIPELMKPILPDCMFAADDVGSMRGKLEAFVSGDLVTPSGEQLTAHVNEHYGADAVVPRIVTWIEG